MAMTVGIITNPDKDPDLSYTALVRNFLTQKGVAIREGEFPSRADFCVVLGGDGTILRCSHLAAICDVPLLGINLGTLGFLTDAEKQDGLEALEKVLAGEYETEKRMMLETELPPIPYLALNDICIGTTGSLKTLSLYVNNHHLDTLRADGLIVATPTGSTAYNLSAGGPILMPGGKMMVITPICPHSLGTRPLVIGESDIVRIVAHQPSPIIIDGETVGELSTDTGITIKKSSLYATTIKTAQSHIYDVLKKKKIL